MICDHRSPNPSGLFSRAQLRDQSFATMWLSVRSHCWPSTRQETAIFKEACSSLSTAAACDCTGSALIHIFRDWGNFSCRELKRNTPLSLLTGSLRDLTRRPLTMGASKPAQLSYSSTGGNPPTGTRGGREEEGDHESFSDYPDRYPDSDRATEWAKYEALPGEHGARREAEKHHWPVWAQGGGENHITSHSSQNCVQAQVWVVRGRGLIKRQFMVSPLD